MSDSDGGPVQREVAHRLFAAEYDDADLEFSESDEERAPNYVVTPTGARVNRVFVVGVLTEVESVSDDVLRARVVDPTGAFVCYAGQYQPDEQAFLERAEPPLFVALTGKARTFQPEDADVIYTSIRPEAINAVDADTRDRWTVQAAEQTLDRVRTAAGALALDQGGDALEAVLRAKGLDDAAATGVPLAFDHYGTTSGYLASLAEVAIQGAELVAGERDEVEGSTLPPDADVVRDLPVEPRHFDVPDDLGLADEAVPASPTEDTDGNDGESDESPESSSVADAAGTGAGADDATGADANVTEGTGEVPTGPDESGAAEADSGQAGAEGSTSEGEVATEAGADAAVASGTAEGSEPDTGATAPETTATDQDGPGDFDADFDLDEDEREEIEDEYGTDFQSGTEVDDPGEADIETPTPMAEEPAADTVPSGGGGDEPVEVAGGADAGDEEAAEEPTADEATTDEAAADEPTADEADEADEDADLADLAVEAMEDLDDGSGADHAAVVAAVVDRTGAAQDAVEDAIQEALMDGRCYEPDDDTLQAI